MFAVAALKMGQRVRVWPRPGARVPEHPTLPGRFLSPAGVEVQWSPWWARRVGDGSVLLINPNAAPASAQPAAARAAIHSTTPPTPSAPGHQSPAAPTAAPAPVASAAAAPAAPAAPPHAPPAAVAHESPPVAGGAAPAHATPPPTNLPSAQPTKTPAKSGE